MNRTQMQLNFMIQMLKLMKVNLNINRDLLIITNQIVWNALKV